MIARCLIVRGQKTCLNGENLTIKDPPQLEGVCDNKSDYQT